MKVFRRLTMTINSSIIAHRQCMRVLLLCVVIAIGGLSATARTAPLSSSSQRENATSQVDDNDRIDIVVRDGFIYISTTRPTNIKIFSILGQLISSTRVPAGTTKLKVPSRGIYILKTDTYTRRLTV